MSAQSAVSFVKDINTNPLTAPSPSNPDPKRPFSGQDSNQFARLGNWIYFQDTTKVTKPVTLIEIGVPDPRPKSLGSFVPCAFAYFQFGNIHQNVGVPTGQNWTSTLPVPNQTSLLGITAVIQAFVLDATTFPANTEATNGVHLTIGK